MELLYDNIYVALAIDSKPLFTVNAKVINSAIDKIYKERGFTPEVLGTAEGVALMNENYRVLSQGIDSGVAMAKSGVAYAVPLDLVAALKNDAFMFSGWKAYHSMREAGINLLDDKGGIKPYELFKKQAGEVFKKQGLNLRAEYQHAVQSSIMATKWSQFEADGERYDLQYRTVGDNKVREAHRQLNGFTAPVTDAFWDSFLPPNGWGCRCTVVQVRKNKYTNSITSEEAITFGKQSTAGDKQKIFRFNPGKQKKIFPPKHPNLPKGCGDCEKKVKLNYNPRNPLCKACAIIATCKDKELKQESSRKWIKDTIEKVSDGKVCKRSIEVCQMPKEVVSYAKKQGIELETESIRITDNRIKHALRDDKIKRGQAITPEQMANIAENIEASDIYFDAEKENFVFVYGVGKDCIKYVIQPNYKTKADGKNEIGNHFLTAGKINDYNVEGWKKIK